MSPVFWMAVGAGTGVYAMVKTRRAAERFTPAGISDQLGALTFGARLLRDEVMVGMVEHETRLREQLALADAGAPAQPALTQGG